MFALEETNKILRYHERIEEPVHGSKLSSDSEKVEPADAWRTVARRLRLGQREKFSGSAELGGRALPLLCVASSTRQCRLGHDLTFS
jgi:hypothetical protein